MLRSNPSADSVASTERRGCLASPFHLLVEAPIGRGTKALNPGGAGAKPLLPSAPHAGRPLIMRAWAIMHELTARPVSSLIAGR
jgi:hypothetical protein